MKILRSFLTHLLRLNPDFTAGQSPARPFALCDLRDGEHGRIVGLDLPAEFRGRLLDLGFLPGTPLRAICRAPLGDPLQVEVRGYRLSLRRSEASRIRIEVLQ